jgi:hypothetical protein
MGKETLTNSIKEENTSVITNEVLSDKEHLGIEIKKQFNDKLTCIDSITVEGSSMVTEYTNEYKNIKDQLMM